MRDLTAQKERIVTQHMNSITERNNEILTLMSKQMKDKKINAGGEFGGFLNSLKAAASLSSESTLGMDSRDRLEYAKLWFQNAENVRMTISEDYRSLLKEIDEQLNLVKEEIRQIDEELKSVENEEQRDRLIKERESILPTAEPPRKNDG